MIVCRSNENFIQVMLSSMNTIADVETLYARLGERDYEAVMSYLADDIAWIVADNSPLADRSPYHGIGEVHSGVFERLTAGFDKLVFDADEIFECNGGERVVALGYYYFKFHGQAEERKAQVAHVWTIRDGRPSSSSNTSIRSRSHATREQSNAPGPLTFRELPRFLVGCSDKCFGPMQMFRRRPNQAMQRTAVCASA